MNDTPFRTLEVRDRDSAKLLGNIRLPEFCCWDGCQLPVRGGTLRVRWYKKVLAVSAQGIPPEKLKLIPDFTDSVSGLEEECRDTTG